jgi:hypothetical protein
MVGAGAAMQHNDVGSIPDDPGVEADAIDLDGIFDN